MNKRIPRNKKATSMPVPIKKPKAPSTKPTKGDQFNIPKSKVFTKPYSAL